MTTVATELAAYRVAVAELPSSARVATPGALVSVVSGTAEGLAAGRLAVTRGARVLIVDRPCHTRGARDELDDLARSGVPVILSRPALRPDVVDDAATPGVPAAVSVQVQVAHGRLGGALVDAVGWARVLAGSALRLQAAWSGADSALADLAGAGEHAATVVASERLGTRGSDRLRATAVGQERVEIVATGPVAVVTHVGERGASTLPRRWESRERLALRRALAALDASERDPHPPTDVTDWCRDVDLAAEILAAP